MTGSRSAERNLVQLDPDGATNAETRTETASPHDSFEAALPSTVTDDDHGRDGFPSPQELAAVDAHLDDVETVLKSLDVDKGLEAQCAELADEGALEQRPALAAYWHAKTEAARRQ